MKFYFHRYQSGKRQTLFVVAKLLKHYHSLIPMATEVRKPIFLLKPVDGAIGAHYQAVLKAYQDFRFLTQKILSKQFE